jgi:glutaryl-CoA dehydrogenase
VVWAKDQEDRVRAVLVEAGTPGFTTRDIEHKLSLRVSVTSELAFDDVRLPATALLPGASGIGAALACLDQARYGIAWGALGALEAVYEEALAWSQQRTSFGQPLAGRQLVQQKLVRMVSEHSRGLLYAHRLARLKDQGTLTAAQVSLGKRDNVRAALGAARDAREILGAAGITTGHGAIRHMLNLETVDTYEGTYDIHTLIVGKALTGSSAL